MDKTVSEKYEESIKVEGNEKLVLQPPKNKEKRQILGKYWCSGIFNYSRKDLIELFEMHKHFEKGIIGNEICPKTGNTHCQTFIAFKKPIRPIEAFKEIKTKWIKCSGDEADNEKYCAKDKDFVKFGENFESDWRIHFTELNCKQKKMITEILIPVCPKFNRQVLWYWDLKGGYGKTITYTYLCDNHKCVVVGGSEKDMKFGLADYIENQGYPKIICINLEKSKDKISYTGLEAMLDGIYFNSKYKSGMVRFPRCRVCVFANMPPDETKMGADRFTVTNLTPECKETNIMDIIYSSSGEDSDA